MGPIHIMLIVAATFIFLIVVYKFWYHPGDTSLTVPDDLVKTLSNVTSTGSMCDVTGVLGLVDMNGSPIETKSIACKSCTGYMSLQPTGTCKYIDETCKVVGDAVPCPFDY